MSRRQQGQAWKQGGQSGGNGGGGRRQGGAGQQRPSGGGGNQYQGNRQGGGGGPPSQRRTEQPSSRQPYQDSGQTYHSGGAGVHSHGGSSGGYSRGYSGQSRGGDRGSSEPQRPLAPLQTIKATDVDKRKFVGTLGKKIDLVVNYFNLAYQTGRNVTNYYIEISRVNQDGVNRELKNKALIRDFFWKFVKSNEEFFGSAYNLIFDDRHQLYTWEKLVIEGEKKEVRMEVQGTNGTVGMVAMEIKKTKSQPVDFNVLNLLLSQFARCSISALYSRVYCEIDRIFMRPTAVYEPLDLNYALLMFKGVQANVKKGPGGIALANYDVTHSAFYKVNVDILQFYTFVKTGTELSAKDYSRLKGDYALNMKQRREMRTLLNGLMLKTKIGIITNYRFTDVSDKTARSMRFTHDTRDKDGRVLKAEEVTVEQYYKKRYGKTLEFPNMPLIQCGPRGKNMFFPMEALMLHDDFQRLRAKLPDALIAKTNRFTTKFPNYRFDDINKMMGDLEVSTNDPFLKNANVKVDPRMLQIEGRVLPAPICAFNRPFGEVMKAKAVLPPEKIIVFSLVVVNKSIPMDDKTKSTFNTLVRDCEKRGMNFAQSGPLEVRDYRFNKATLGDFLVECQKKATMTYPNAILMLIIVVGNQDNQIYDSVKTECEINIGILSQVLLSKTYYKIGDRPELQNSVTRNIFLKINAKLGGVNNKILKSQQVNWEKFTDPVKPTLFIGIDVTHQAPGDTEFPSIAALVSNLDVHSTVYSATVRIQMVRTEEIMDMRDMCKQRILEFKKFNKNYPAHIVVFRDGVSESQFEKVVDMELADLKRACTDINLKYSPNFTVIVVQKRHSTRFYASDSSVSGVNNGNTPPGTVVDRFITNETTKIKEFYLCPHKGMLGTSRPIHCYVLYDDWNLSADDLEICTYNLCHLFARAPMAVSLPAPVFYAHLCCYRARRHFAAQRDERDCSSDKQRMVTVCKSIQNSMYFC